MSRNGNVRREGFRGGYSFAAIAGLPDHFEIRLFLQHQPKSLPHHRMIVRQNNSDQTARSFSGVQLSLFEWKIGRENRAAAPVCASM